MDGMVEWRLLVCGEWKVMGMVVRVVFGEEGGDDMVDNGFFFIGLMVLRMWG